MTINDLAAETAFTGLYSNLDLLERNEYLKEELKVCRKHIEELGAEVARLTEELRMAEKNELLAGREARELRNYLPHSQPSLKEDRYWGISSVLESLDGRLAREEYYNGIDTW